MYPVIYDFGNIDIFGFQFNPVINSYGFIRNTLAVEYKRLYVTYHV